MRKILFTSFVFLSNFFISQNRENPINIQSPIATSLGKFGDLDMDLNTGRSNVSVPLYNLDEKGIPLNIYMSYDTGGVRVNDMPGWVGQNWTFNAGGIITRTVKGKSADEMFFSQAESGNVYDWKGYFYYKDLLNGNNWNSPSYLANLAGNALHYPDYEPDIFTFNFMGYSGKFFLGSDGEWKVSSASNLKVVIDIEDKVRAMNFPANGNYNNVLFPKVLGKISIMDDKGNKFVFGDLTNQNSIEFSFQNFFNQVSKPIISSAWHLTKVYDKYNQLIYDLDYERGDYIASFYNRNSIDKISVTTNSWIGGGCASGDYDGNTVYSNGNLIIPSYLKKITTYSSKQIVFSSTVSNSLKYGANDNPIINTYERFRQEIQNSQQANLWSQYDDNYFYYIRRDYNMNVLPSVTGGNLHIYPYLETLKWRKLLGFSVFSANQNYLSTVSLAYNDNPSSRLRLDKITINNIDSENKQSYLFEYNDFDQLPILTSNNIDHFGYYKSTSFTLNMDNPWVHEPSRATDPTKVAYGTLSKIIYPTKGYTKFSYEPHTYSQYVGNNLALQQETGLIGGVRVKSIFSYDGTGVPDLRKFKYANSLQSSQSSGILLQKNNYYMPDYKMPTTASGVTIYKSNFSISPIVYLSNLMGSTIEYSTVIEENGKGKIVYNYSTYADSPDSTNDIFIAEDRNKFDPHTEYFYKRGKIKKKEFYDKQGNKVRQEDFTYQDINNQNVRGFSYTSVAPCAGYSNAPMINGSSYNIFFSDYELVNKKNTNYFQNGGAVEQNESYSYLKHNNFGDNFLIKNISTTPDKLVSDDYIYPFQVGDQISTALLNKRMYPILQKETFLNSIKIEKERSTYGMAAVDNSSSLILAQESKNNFNLVDNTEFNKITYQLYDDFGNVLQYTMHDGNPAALVWGYNKTKLIAKVEGATYNQVKPYISNIINNSNNFMTTPSFSHTTFLNSLNDFRKEINLKDFHISTYTYNNGGAHLKTVTKPDGQVEQYIYDNRNRLAKILNRENEIIKDFNYNFSDQSVQSIHFNSEKKASLRRNNCGGYAIGGLYDYYVQEGAYNSQISQDDADLKAQNDLNMNAQNAANQNGTCVPFSCPISFNTSIGISGGGGISVSAGNLNFYNLTFGFTSGSNSTNLPWTTTGVKVATITGTCLPQTDYNGYNGQVYYTIKTNGDVILRSHSIVYPNNSSYNYQLIFPINY